MADLPETSSWEAGVYQIETTDPVVGGPPDLALSQGISNVPPQQLANRTLWLKDQLAALQSTAVAQTDIDAAIATLIGGAPLALDTLNELAAALADDENYAATITTALAGKIDKSTPQLLGPLNTNGHPVDETHGSDISAATALVIPRDGNFFTMTGANGVEITSIDPSNLWPVGARVVIRSHRTGKLIHDPLKLWLKNNQDIEVAIKDYFVIRKETASLWYLEEYHKFDGTALVGGQGLGVNQTWQDVKASRTGGTTYQNTTGRSIMAAVTDNLGSYPLFQVSTDGTTWATHMITSVFY